MRIKDIKSHLERGLGVDLTGVPHAKGTLLELGKGVKRDRTTENLVIRGTWKTLLSHIKYALGFKGTNFFFRVVTDEKIKNVFVGNEGYRARSKELRDDMPTFNSLEDLLGGDIDLAIIKLGYLGYKNRAAAGCLKEVLLLRANINKPTWLIDDPNRPWEYSKDPDLVFYIDEHYTRIVIEDSGTVDHDVLDAPDEVPDDEEIEEIEGHVNEEPPDQPPDFDEVDDDDDDDEPEPLADLEMPGEGRKKPWKPNKWGRR